MLQHAVNFNNLVLKVCQLKDDPLPFYNSVQTHIWQLWWTGNAGARIMISRYDSDCDSRPHHIILFQHSDQISLAYITKQLVWSGLVWFPQHIVM